MLDGKLNPACKRCIEYDPGKGCCMREWNNLDPSYYIPERDDRDPYDLCEHYDFDGEMEED